VLRPGDSASTFTPDQYYRVGTPAFSSNRIYRSKRNEAFTTFSTDEWEPTLPMLTNERGIEALRIAIGPELLIDKDLSNDPASTNLGVNQETDADILAQVRSATDYRGIGDFMQAIGYSSSNVNSILTLQDNATVRDWDPSALSSPAPSGKLSARGFWPLEFNRPSLIRAFGQAYEWAGQGNYSKAMPKYQVTALSDQHKIDYFAVNHMGGRVYNTGFNEDGLIVQGDTINDLGTNTVVTTETAGLGALGGDPDFPVVPTSFDTLTVTDEFNALQEASFNNITINGVIDGAPTFAPNFLPVASETVEGIIELATSAEVAAFNEINKAVTPATLGDVRGAADGFASLDGSTKLPTAQLPNIPEANLPAASTTLKGIIEIATNTEAAAYSDTSRALVPSNLAALRGAANGLATLDGSSLLPTAQLPEIPLANIPTLTNAKLPVLELAKLPTIPANKLLTVPVAWVSGNTNFDLSANFTFSHSGTATSLALGAPTTAGYIGTSGFIYVTNATGVALSAIDNANWYGAVNTWVNPTNNTTGLTGNLIIGYYIAAANTVVYTASMVS
jgi:hypothetical protein